VLLRARREYHVIKRKVKFQNKRQRVCVCVRQKKSAMKEEIEREKSCFWDIFLLLLPLFLSLLSLFIFSNPTQPEKSARLCERSFFGFNATTRTLSVLLLLHSRAHTKRQNNENTLHKERRWL